MCVVMWPCNRLDPTVVWIGSSNLVTLEEIQEVHKMDELFLILFQIKGHERRYLSKYIPAVSVSDAEIWPPGSYKKQ